MTDEGLVVVRDALNQSLECIRLFRQLTPRVMWIDGMTKSDSAVEKIGAALARLSRCGIPCPDYEYACCNLEGGHSGQHRCLYSAERWHYWPKEKKE